MAKDNTKGLKKHAKKRTDIALEKADKAIRNLSMHKDKINFNSVAKESGVSKSFLYNNHQIKERIEDLRQKQVNIEMNQISKKNKTSKSRDAVIQAKDKKIKELKRENIELKRQLKILRGTVYDRN
ncbi:DUF6262 family protein [Natronospora cellulosivora (SeqCode)]